MSNTQSNSFTGHTENHGKSFQGNISYSGNGNVYINSGGEASDKDIEFLQNLKEWSGSYEVVKNRHPNRVQGTCQWTLRHKKFRSWYQKNSGILWITADPGCGKSVLSKSLIDNELKANDTRTTCYYFFKDNSAQNRITTALCALLHQIFSQKPTLLHYARQYYQNNGQSLKQEFFELWRLLEQVAMSGDAGHIVCILDALDECHRDDVEFLIPQLESLWNRSQSQETESGNLKFLVTSRAYNRLERIWYMGSKISELRIQGEDKNEEIGEEINLVIDDWVLRFADGGKRLSTATQEKLKQHLRGIQNRTYLWLYLALEQIEKSYKHTGRALFEDLLKNIPTSVNEAYHKILNESEDKEAAKYILQIIIAARYPLTLTQLNIALEMAIHDTADNLDVLDLQTDEWKIKVRLRNVCGLFIFESQSRVYLIHQTAKEYLFAVYGAGIDAQGQSASVSAWKSTMTDPKCHLLLAGTCMRSFFMKEVVESISDIEECSTKDLEHLNYYQDFLTYSIQNWVHHYRYAESERDIRLLGLALKLHDPDSCQNFLWANPYIALIRMMSEDQDQITTMSLGAVCGHQSVVEKSISSTWLVSFKHTIQPRQKNLALELATIQAHMNLVQFLIQKGAKYTKKSHHELSVFFWRALREGNDETISLLIENVEDIDVPDEVGWRPLCWATSKGNYKIASLLLEKGASLEAADRSGWTALTHAACNGHEKLITLLLGKGANLEAADQNGWTPLNHAARNGHEKTIEMLLGKGANLESLDMDDRTVLGRVIEAAVPNGSNDSKIIQLLLANGANIGGVDQVTRTHFFQTVCSMDDQAMIKLLIEKGADVNAQGGRFGNALLAACIYGHKSTAQLLIEAEANVNAKGGRFGNALQAACARGHESIAQLLIEKGADINAQGGRFGNALQAACAHGHESIAQLLIERGANVNAQGGRFGNALEAACIELHESILQLLVENGADVNAHVKMFGNALQAVCYAGHDSIVQLLIEKGADVNAQGGEFGNALQAACINGHKSTVKLLIEAGANIDAQGGQYGNAVEAAHAMGHTSITRLLK